MKKIEEIDPNFKPGETISEEDIIFYNVKEEPFDLYGLYNPENEPQFKRMPDEAAEATGNPGVQRLYTNTAGGRVRFKTDSPYIAISVKLPNITRFSHMPLTGTSSFDMYIYSNSQYKYSNTFIIRDSHNITENYETIHKFANAELRDITINFPLYNDVSELYIGVKEGCILTHGEKYINEKPIVYYGSSITQGGCASKPGNSYQGMISRRMNCDFVNLGFSGSAKAERVMAEYIAGLDMSCFVYDYDHNAPTTEYLRKTHKPMFDIIRKANPELPVIMVSRPNGNEAEERKKVILETYNNAIENGDEKVYFVDGQSFYKDIDHGAGTVDGTHPNDLGFMCMANKIYEVLKGIDICQKNKGR